MESYAKLYQRILDSSVWKQPSDIRIVWITLLALKDENGCVFGSLGWLADRARVSDESCERAIRIFCSPDKRSRTMSNDGRKLQKIDGGWQVLNHLLYRDGMEAMREKWRRQKARQREKSSGYVGETPRERAYVKAEERGDLEEADRIAAMRSAKELGDEVSENG